MCGRVVAEVYNVHCSDSESEEMNVGNEIPEKSTNLPQVDKAESIAVEELEASEGKNMVVLEVLSEGEPIWKDNAGTVAIGVLRVRGVWCLVVTKEVELRRTFYITHLILSASKL